MEEDFELISKSDLKAIKEENERLKKGIDSVDGLTEVNPKLISEISALLTEEAKKERMFILKNLEEIKELNKQTLNNVLTRTEAMEFKIEDLIDNLSKLVETVSEVVKNSPNAPHHENDSKIEDLKNSVDALEMHLDSATYKLSDIDDFMKKLKVLLGQIKPADMSLPKPEMASQSLTPTNPTGEPPAFNK